jgi:general secretion pathway protein A
MYEQFFGLRERPFDLTPNPRYLVLTDSHQEALSNLEYAITSRKGITLLVGEAGSGKTTIIRAAMERQPARVHPVHLNNPTMTRAEFTEMLALRFGLSERATRSKAVFLVEIETLLRRRHQRGEVTLVVVDEAQSLPLELLEEIRLLVNIESDHDKLLSVIIAGQPELATRLNDASLRQLKQRVALRCHLRSLTDAETTEYIDGRVKAAGGPGKSIFTPEAIAQIHHSARGIPRTVSVIADNALLGGFANGERPVGVAIVKEVCQDFDLTDSEATPQPAAPTVVQTPYWSPSPVQRHPRKPHDAVAAAARAETPRDRTVAQEMFGGVSPKRKRFSFFGS